MNKIAFLILIHKPIDHLYSYAKYYKDVNFYIHVDAKANLDEIKKGLVGANNIYFVENRISVNWGGFSMVQATLNLMNYALQHDVDNDFFHLISGDDVILSDKLYWEDNTIYMDFRSAEENRYRVRFNSVFADTLYQRRAFSKLLTQAIKFFDKLIGTQKKYYIGSQWFSIRREQLCVMLNSITQSDIKFFTRKLCPDEHFFQYLIKKNNLIKNLSKDNRRFLIFDKSFQNGSSPIFLSLEQLLKSQKEGLWFARKVDQETMKNFYNFRSSVEI